MFPPTKRLNYFDHQFLRVDDFSDEQAYHLGMRRAHNRLLHAPGVAQGLAVTHAGSTLTVSSGVALDGEGREIVLREPVELDAPPDVPTAWVTIAYGERPAEPTTETGVAGDRRCEEAPTVRVDSAPPSDPETRLVLARVTLAGGRVTGVDDGVATLHRRVAGPAPGAELEVRSLAVQGSATVGGTLTVEQTLSVGGALAVERTLSVGETLSLGGAEGGATLNLPGGRAGGDLRVGTGDNRLDVSVGVTSTTAGTARLRAEGTAPRLVLGAAGTDVLTVQADGVGIGAAPAAGYALNVGGVVNATDVLLDGEPLHASQWANVTEGITFNDGNVGVGVSVPRARLHVAGGSGDLGVTEGDFAIGNAVHRLKVGITTTGTGAGNVRVRAVGGTQKLMLGGGASDMLTVTETAVGVGTTTPGYRFHAVGAGPAVGTIESTTSTETYLTLTNKDGVNKRVEFCNRDGIAAIWTGGPVDALRVTRNGDVQISGSLTIGGIMMAQAKVGYVVDHFVNRTGEPVEQGDVVVLGERGVAEYWSADNSIPIPEVDLTSKPHDRRVCGIVDRVTTAQLLPPVGDAGGDIHPLAHYAASDDEDGDPATVGPGQMGSMVTLGAYAHCKVDADIAEVRIGDLLTTSPTRGHAQKVLDPAAAQGTIVGKALAPLARGRGKIPVMVLLQ